MSIHLVTDTDLADQFGITVEKLHELRRKHKWPHVRLGRFEYRFTDDQVREIVAASSVVPKQSAARGSGLTERSARRSA